jgi:hypothetical protein
LSTKEGSSIVTNITIKNFKTLLVASSTLPKFRKRRHISQEQMDRLINYVLSYGISLHKASFKVKTSYPTIHYYYSVCKNNPEKKIPVPPQSPTDAQTTCTQEQITKVFKHIVDDDMLLLAISTKVNKSYSTALGISKPWNSNVIIRLLK